MTTAQRPVPAGYEFIQILGAGGFGEVVLARHVRLNRLVAIKRIHEYALADDEALQRFEREAKVLASTNCASVVRVYDLCRSDDLLQLVMEYVPGRALSELLEAGPLPIGEALVVLRDIADALAAAAARGVVHRDIKPANVFVLPSGHAKLGDFGLARIVSDPAVFRTTAQQAMGTPAYFPPEVSKGLAEPDARSDAYSFAVMAYEVLTGRLPLGGDDAVSRITAHWTQKPAHPGTALPGFPERAAVTLLAGLDKDPAGRPLPQDLVEQLTAVPPDSWPVVTRPDTPAGAVRPSDPTVRRPFVPPAPAAPPPPPPRRRSRRRLALVTGLCLVAGLGAAAGAQALLVPDPTLRVESVTVTSDPPSGQARCPEGNFTFTASIRTNGAAGTINVGWTRPDGVSTEPRLVQVASGQRRVQAQLRFTVSGTQPVDGQAVIHVWKPNAASAAHAMHYECEAP